MIWETVRYPVALTPRVVGAYPLRMALTFRKLHPTFVGEARGVELRTLRDPGVLADIRAGMDEYGVLVFPDQPLTDEEHLAFAQALDGALHTRTGSRVLSKSRFGNEALGDISNLGIDGEILQSGDRKRAYGLGNRLWHTDASFQDPPGRYSMLSAKVVPPVGADTEYADLRGAYDALPAETKIQIADLCAHHSIAYSRQVLGFEFSQQEEEALKGAIHPLVRTLPRSNRKSLYVASHASRGSSTGRSPRDGCCSATSSSTPPSASSSIDTAWRVGDLVIWDNRCTMHRATPFEDTKYRRELRRVTTLDIPNPPWSPAGLRGGEPYPAAPLAREGEPAHHEKLAEHSRLPRTRCPRRRQLPARRSQHEPDSPRALRRQSARAA